MAADSSAEISKLFGTYLEEDGVTTRATFIIDPEGVIRIIELHDNDIGRNVDEILRKLDAAIHVRINPGEVCPENWSSGLPTILKNLNRVGKI